MRGLLNLFKNKLSIARQLSLTDWILLSLAWWTLLWYALYLKWGSFGYPASPAGYEPSDSRLIDSARHLHRLVELASRLHPFPMTCLPRALTLRRLLAWRGIPSLLRIGVAGQGSGMQAHAWVVVAGVPVGEAEDVAEKFSVLEHVSSQSSYTFSP
jgi:hypothetical protein